MSVELDISMKDRQRLRRAFNTARIQRTKESFSDLSKLATELGKMPAAPPRMTLRQAAKQTLADGGVVEDAAGTEEQPELEGTE